VHAYTIKITYKQTAIKKLNAREPSDFGNPVVAPPWRAGAKMQLRPVKGNTEGEQGGGKEWKHQNACPD